MLTETELQGLIDANDRQKRSDVALETGSITSSLYSDRQDARLIDFKIVRAGEEMSGRVRLSSDRSERELRDLLSGVAQSIVNGQHDPEAIGYL